MTDVLTTEDPLYLELYDVRREAQVMGNLVEEAVPLPILVREHHAKVVSVHSISQ